MPGTWGTHFRAGLTRVSWGSWYPTLATVDIKKQVLRLRGSLRRTVARMGHRQWDVLMTSKLQVLQAPRSPKSSVRCTIVAQFSTKFGRALIGFSVCERRSGCPFEFRLSSHLVKKVGVLGLYIPKPIDAAPAILPSGKINVKTQLLSSTGVSLPKFRQYGSGNLPQPVLLHMPSPHSP